MWRGNLPGAKCFLFITNPFFIESSSRPSFTRLCWSIPTNRAAGNSWIGVRTSLL